MKEFKLKEFITEFIDSRTNNMEERHRLIVFMMTMFVVFIGFPCHIFGLVGTPSTIMRLLSAISIFSSATLVILYVKRKIELVPVFTIFGIIGQGVQTLKILLLTFYVGGDRFYLIPLNHTISMVYTMLFVMAYSKIMPTIITGVSLTTYIISMAYLNDEKLFAFFVVFFFVQFFICFAGSFTRQSFYSLQQQNQNYHISEKRLNSLLRLKRDQIEAYLNLCQNDHASDKDIDRLFAILDDRSQRNIVNAVKKKMAELKAEKSSLVETFTDFTPTEIEVSRLILLDKKLKEICITMGKSETNINSVRSHIRKKLGLSANEVLKDALESRIKTKNVF
ncbi:hypothetical protein L6471_03000 [Segatella bryantii]|uniref:helix-turn-helix transcriptional regulator n=1 Tax=Segatella bryantii TaxID=77095 RepID=UPI001EDB0302|nr:hypothetical protein [Segatella bryantii]UKK74689.1 hypothetical protein L6471_03000 [Segatella bryantii]